MPGTSFSAASWTGYDTVTVANPASALTDFTVVIDLSELSTTGGFGANVQSDGGDIRLTKGDGTTELPYDLIDWSYNAGSPTGLLRVKWSSTLATSGTQEVRVWAGYTGGTAVAYDATETYGSDNGYDSNWIYYYPLVADGADRTASGLDLTAQNGLTFGGGTGPDGTAATSFTRASSHYAQSSGSEPANSGDWTQITWAKLATDVQAYVNDHDEEEAAILSGLGFTNNYGIWGAAEVAADARVPEAAIGSWKHVGFVKSGTQITGYGDGAATGTDTSLTGDHTPAGSVVTIGAKQSGAGNWSGEIYSISYHDTARPAAWIAYEYGQTNDNAAYHTFGGWTAAGGGDDPEALTVSAVAATTATGPSATLAVTRQLAVSAPAAITSSGLAASLTLTRQLTATAPAAATIATQSADLALGVELTVTGPATVTTSGLAASLSVTRQLTASGPAAITASGLAATLNTGTELTVTGPAAATATGLAASLLLARQLIASAPAAITTTGRTASLSYSGETAQTITTSSVRVITPPTNTRVVTPPTNTLTVSPP